MNNRLYSIVKILLPALCLFSFFSYKNLFAQPFVESNSGTSQRTYGGCSVIHTDSNSLILEFDLPNMQIQKRILYGQAFDQIELEGATYLRLDGLPVLPIFVQTIGIPSGVTPIASISVDEQTIDTRKYRLIPYQQEHLQRDRTQDKLVIDSDFYRQSKFYPTEIVEFEPIGYIRNQRVGRLKIYPIQYNPATGQIRIHKRLVVKIDFGTTLKTPNAINRNSPFEHLFRASLINYEQAKAFRDDRDGRSTGKSSVSLEIASGPVQISSSDSYKLTILETGMYKVSYSMLKAAGADLTDVDVNTIKIFNDGREVSIYVHQNMTPNSSLDTFDEDDYIVFYGQSIVNSKFTDENVYILSWGGNKGLRPLTVSGKPEHVPSNEVMDEAASDDEQDVCPTAFKTMEHFELDRLHDPLVSVKSELVDHFFWSGFTANSKRDTHTYPLILPYSASISDSALIRLRLQGISYSQNEKHIAVVTFNTKLLDEGILRWNGQENPIFEIEMPQSYISPDSKNYLTIECHDKNNTPENELDFCLDWYEIEYWHTFQADRGRLEFSSHNLAICATFASEDAISSASEDAISSLKSGAGSRVEITGFSNPEIDLFEIGEDGVRAKIVNGLVEIDESVDGEEYKFIIETNPTVPTKYYAIQKNYYSRPKKVEKYNSSGIRNPNNQADYIIISHENFIDSIDRLAEFRRQNGLSVIVVDVEDIYNEFSNGIFNPMAIKSFLRYAYNNWQTPEPTYVLLVGDGHWDYKDAYAKYYRDALGIIKDIPPIFVPTYHGWSPEGGETAMDHKFVTISGDDALPDMFIGRLPVQTTSELDAVVDKIINYEQKLINGVWQSRIMQIADNDSDNAGDEKFQKSRETLVKEIIPPAIETLEVYLKEIVSPYRTKQMIIDGMREGLLVVEYSGHGGANSWAHEGIFMISDIQTVRNERLPFVITTTCLNGIFDKPLEAGYRSISEEFLLIEEHGAIANLSASRLTYADANSAFDKNLFENMFSIRPAVIGAIINAAKINFITEQTELWLPNVQQYILLGDPATVLALPQLEVKVDLKEQSLDPSKKLRIEQGIIKISEVLDTSENYKDFNADLELSVIYPNNFDKDASNDLPVFQRKVPVWNGEYGEISIDIPDGVIPGDGIVRMFASNGEITAIGGTRFSMYNPVILSDLSMISEDEEFLLIFIAIADNKGVDGIQSIFCDWHNTVDFKPNSTEMIPSEGGQMESGGVWYELKEPIPLPKGGRLIKYRITVTDDENNSVEMNERVVEAPMGPNLTLSRYPDSGSPMITYEYQNAWVLRAQLENNGGKSVKSAIWVYFTDGNPDRNGNSIIDEDAPVLGRVRVSVDEWKQSAISNQQSAIETASVELVLDKSLTSGYHKIYVWVDPELPEYDHQDEMDGEILEPYSYDNKISYLFPINDFVLMDEDLTTYSLDNILKVFFPKGATGPTTISISSIPLLVSQSSPITIVGDSLTLQQPDIIPAMLPGETEYEAFSIELASGVEELKKSAEVTLKFDIAKLENKVIKETGILSGPQLEAQILEEANKLAIYFWISDKKMWKKLNSELLVESEDAESETTFAWEKYISLPEAKNASNQIFSASNVELDPSISPTGEWVILFVDSQRYQILLKRTNADSYETLERQGKIGEIYKDEIVGIELNIPDPESAEDTEFELGDRFYFKSFFDTYYGITKVQNIRTTNYGDGSAHIRIKSDDVDKKVFGKYVLLFCDSDEYEIRDEQNMPLRYSYGSIIYGKVNKPSNISPLGIELIVNAGERSFMFGDKFKFEITEVGAIKAELDKISTVTLMQNNDTTSPSVYVWVDGQEAQPASVIPPRPEMSLLLSDRNGIDIDTFSFKLSKNDGGFVDVPKDDYVVNDQTTTVTVRYTPILFIGKYTYRISVEDLNGNGIKTDGKDYLTHIFFVEEQPDLTPPSISVEVQSVQAGQPLRLKSEAILNDGDVLTEPSIFRVIITDEHGITPDNVVFSFAEKGLSDSKDQDYDFDFDENNPTKAVITYEPDLPNGDYQIQVEALDTSKNAGQLQLQFSMDEPVLVSELLNAPNPFKKDTVFVYELTQVPDDVTIKIYTLTGRLIKTIEMASVGRHYNEQYWDGRDDNGERLANGTYFYKFIVQTEGRKIVKIGKLAVLR